MNKYIFTVSLLFWANIGLFYVFYLLKLETVLIGVFRELTLIPSFLGGVLLPLLLVNNFFKKKMIQVPLCSNSYFISSLYHLNLSNNINVL